MFRALNFGYDGFKASPGQIAYVFYTSLVKVLCWLQHNFTCLSNKCYASHSFFFILVINQLDA